MPAYGLCSVSSSSKTLVERYRVLKSGILQPGTRQFTTVTLLYWACAQHIVAQAANGHRGVYY